MEASMKQKIIHIGLDVDDTQYHGAAFNKATGEVVDFKSRPTLKGLLQQLGRMARHFKGHKIKLYYEASYIGYCLQRDLSSSGVHCDITRSLDTHQFSVHQVVGVLTFCYGCLDFSAGEKVF